MRIAAIDLGTNSFLCLIADVSGRPPHTQLKIIYDTYKVVRLGEKVHQNRRFLPEALGRAQACLDEFAAAIKKHKAEKVVATATSAARDASNGEELMRMGRERGIPIHIIGGAKEAELSFAGAVSNLANAHDRKILVVDVGGGSTELIYREPGKSPRGHSFDVGCVRLTEMFIKKDPLDKAEYEKMSAHTRKVISAYGNISPDDIIAVAGTPTTLACVAQGIDFDEHKVEGYRLTREKIAELSERLGRLPLSERKSVKGLEPLRADVILAGCAVLLETLGLAGRDEMQVSTRGLRFGVALHHDEF